VATVRETRGVAQLPAPLAPAEFTVQTAYGSAALQGDGSFTVPADGSGPTLLFLRHNASGAPTLLGLVGEERSALSPLSTGVALLYLSMGLAALTPALQRQAIAALEGHVALTPLAETIARRVAADPLALRNGDAEIAAALKIAFEVVTTGSRAARAVSRAELPPIVGIVQGDQSLARLLQRDDSQSVIPVNLGRRPAVAYTYQTGHQSAAGRIDLPAARRIAGPQELPAVTSWVGSAFSLGTLPAWAPVEGDPISLSMESGATKTFFETIVLMASGKTDAEGEPTFFTAPRYAGELAGWRSDRERLNKHAWISGILFDLVKSALGGAATALSFAGVNAIIAELEAIEAAAAEKVLEAAGRGLYGRSTELFMRQILGSDIIGQRLKNVAIRLVGLAEQAGQAALREQMALALVGMAEVVLGVLAAAGTLLALGDLLTTYSDVMRSEKAALWNVNLLRPTLTLNPSTAVIAPGDSVTFSAGAVGVEDGNVDVTYRWKKSDTNSVLSERDWTGSPNVGNEIETKTRVVELTTSPSSQERITVTVEGFVGGKSLGTATANVTVDPKKRLFYGRYESRISENGGNVGAFIVFPRQRDAVSYSVYASGFNDTAYYGKELRRGVNEPPNYPSPEFVQAYDNFQTEGEIGLFLSGASGGPENVGQGKAWLDSRFAGMVVKVTAQLK
jgi:hypothetical protein